MRVIERETLRSRHDYGGGVFEGLQFRKCEFLSCGISNTTAPEKRSVAREIRLEDCSERGCAIDTLIAEDIVVDRFETHGLLQTWGAVFKHVTLRGRLGRFMFSDRVSTGMATRQEQAAFDEANAAYYRGVDWALDLTEAEFTEEPDIRGVPGRLIRRDPRTQIVITRERAMTGTWRQLDLSRTSWGAYIQGMLDDGYPDVVLVAPKKSRRFKDAVMGIERLRDAGIGE